ncbi:hypothetical protein [Sutcliffiella cohnii]|nr:hypothetical protein [Sutcliffiella cohnii]
MSNIDVGILKGVIIIKERKTPIYLLMLEAAKRRVPVKHPSRSLLEEELWKQQAGFRGEKTLDYYL